jgi:ABC-2 type transport system permease protein
MKRVWIIAGRECRSYFDSPVAYIFLLAYVLLSLIDFRANFYADSQVTLRRLFADIDLMLLILVPVLSMRLWAEESRSGTLDLLLTWPIKLWEIILGKFLASILLIAVAFILLLPTVFVVASMGDLDFGPVILGFVGAWLLGAAYLAVSCALSSFTSSQVVAYILSALICGFFLLLGEPVLLAYLPTSLVGFFEALGFGSRYRHFEQGLFRISDVTYYLSWICLGLYVTYLSLERHRRPGR